MFQTNDLAAQSWLKAHCIHTFQPWNALGFTILSFDVLKYIYKFINWSPLFYPKINRHHPIFLEDTHLIQVNWLSLVYSCWFYLLTSLSYQPHRHSWYGFTPPPTPQLFSSHHLLTFFLQTLYLFSIKFLFYFISFSLL